MAELAQLTTDQAVGGEKTKIFVSYSRLDREFVAKLVAALEAREDIDVFRDTEDILPTEEWRDRLANLIAEADTIVFCLSPHSATSEVCAWEVEYAESLNKRIAPIVVREVGGQVPGGLAKLNYIFFTERDDFDNAFTKLVTALNTNIGWIREHTRLGDLSRRWAANSETKDQLLHGKDVEAAERWASYRPTNAPELNGNTVKFIDESRKEAIASRRRSQIAVAVVIVLFTIIGAGWLTQERWLPLVNVGAYRLMNLVKDFSKAGETFQECSSCPEMVVVPAGSFMMGSPETEKYRTKNEGPLHRVTISMPFAVSKFEVTFDEWDACFAAGGCKEAAADGGYGRGIRPVINISWDDIQHYVSWISKLTRQKYRLLSEAEWEYSARAGSTTAYSWGNEIGKNEANCVGCGSKWDSEQTAPVGYFKPNAFGLYDMHSNVAEWVEDCWNTDYLGTPEDGSAMISGNCENRVIRGGSWTYWPAVMRAASRDGYAQVFRYANLGFRVGRTLTP